MTSVDFIGYLAGFFLMLSFLPQLTKTIKTRKVEDLSLGMLGVTLTSGILYEIYAIQLQLLPVIIMNGIFVMIVLVQLLLTVRLRH